MTVAFITHAAAGDTFWDLVRKGAEDAAEKDGVTLEYTLTPTEPTRPTSSSRRWTRASTASR